MQDVHRHKTLPVIDEITSDIETTIDKEHINRDMQAFSS